MNFFIKFPPSALLLTASASVFWGYSTGLAQQAPLVIEQAEGSYVVEPWEGIYRDLKIQSWDQKIVTAGATINPNDPATWAMLVARYGYDGTPDTSFGSNGVSILSTTGSGALATTSGGNALQLQSDGKVIVAGETQGKFGVARFKSNGVVDTSFGSGGYRSVSIPNTNTPSYLNLVALQSNGKIVTGGYATNTSSPHYETPLLARFTASGALDTGSSGFGTVSKRKALGYLLENFGGSIQTGEFIEIFVLPNDKILAIAGVGLPNQTKGQTRLTRYTAAGQLDKTFNGTGYATLVSPSGNVGYVKMLSDGSFIACGATAGLDGSADATVMHFNANGSLDMSFGGGTGYARLDVDGLASTTREYSLNISVGADGRIVVVGLLDTRNTWVARLNADGTLDESFGLLGYKVLTPPENTATVQYLLYGYAVDIQADGTIIVAGYLSDTNNTAHPALMHFDP